eukprot:CAMPEP_0202902612 /NCGR_PEP_ID=MMETSP1392-20130828/16956_1 /ASSEMBLY_ACC=CAM_ASM_000868 /TAXON_ID=225041 /ORGANISM="Chlamydomonas chlamydogama, Strain SAG 11-48b" /LENGTH=47 /DNA_ID= /DNA_START= /DNA_END= /DNA_ORIENTATION=
MMETVAELGHDKEASNLMTPGFDTARLRCRRAKVAAALAESSSFLTT